MDWAWRMVEWALSTMIYIALNQREGRKGGGLVVNPLPLCAAVLAPGIIFSPIRDRLSPVAVIPTSRGVLCCDIVSES